MSRKPVLLALIMGLAVICAAAWAPLKGAYARDHRSIIEKYQPPRTAIYSINQYNRTHRKGNIWLTITNWGFFGNYGPGDPDALEDPEFPGTWAPQCEYPGNSEVQYLFMGAIWLGALVQEGGFEFARVSVGSEGWTGPGNNNFELEPGEVGGLPQEEHGIRERSTIPNTYNRLGEYVYDSLAIAEQDFLAVYSDTLHEQYWTGTDERDGVHFPLGVRIKQSSYSWSYNYAQEFILMDYEFENIASNFLKNLYVALYVDADVGWIGEGIWHEDDICGFQQWYYFQRTNPDGTVVPDSLLINTAWIADNDGRPQGVNSGSEFTCPAVTGVRVVRAPNPRLRTSFNWWISNGNANLDFGPSWQDDGSEQDWTTTYGTPVGDARKYFVMKNAEFDYDQVHVWDADYIGEHSQWVTNRVTGDSVEHNWKLENLTYAYDLANGYDTRYLLSWGPLGIYDHTDAAGNDVYRLNPGEKFHMTLGYVAGANFHSPQNYQGDVSGNNLIDPSKFNFANLQYNAAWAARVYDNEMVDSPIYDWGNDHNPATADADGSQGDGKVETGDGWYGEDTGTDFRYAAEPGAMCVYFGVPQGIYTGPDANGTERNGRLDPGEDLIYRPEFVNDPRYGDLNIGYTMNNGVLDPGDGIPDFKGPPPPPIPELFFTTSDSTILLRWKNNAEDLTYYDPFSQKQDFEGYRVYVSNTGLEYDYQLLAEFDRVDFAYYSLNDSLATYPDILTNMPADSTFPNGVTFYRQPVGGNSGLESIREPGSDSTYIYPIQDAHALFPRYFAVTAFDYGDPKSGTEPLETARSANAKYIAPSGNPQNKVRVVPNPYRAYQDYTQTYLQTGPGSGLSWENQDDGTPEFFPQTDRRIEFMNLPANCLIRIYTVAGDLVQIIPHSSEGLTNTVGDNPSEKWVSEFSEDWDLNNRNGQQVVSGLYLFSVENLTPGNVGKIEVGKFVIIR